MSDLVSPCAKCLLIIINVVFMFVAVGFIALGVIMQSEFGFGAPGFSLGGFIFLISFFGCCGATQECRCLLITYSIAVILLMITEIFAVVYALPAFVAMTHVNNEIENATLQTYRPSYDTNAYIGLGVLGAIQCLSISMAIFMTSQLKIKKPVPYIHLQNQEV